jgi:hypothetical protein
MEVVPAPTRLISAATLNHLVGAVFCEFFFAEKDSAAQKRRGAPYSEWLAAMVAVPRIAAALKQLAAAESPIDLANVPLLCPRYKHGVRFLDALQTEWHKALPLAKDPARLDRFRLGGKQAAFRAEAGSAPDFSWPHGEGETSIDALVRVGHEAAKTFTRVSSTSVTQSAKRNTELNDKVSEGAKMITALNGAIVDLVQFGGGLLDLLSGGAGTLAASTAVAALKQVQRAAPLPASGHASSSSSASSTSSSSSDSSSSSSAPFAMGAASASSSRAPAQSSKRQRVGG